MTATLLNPARRRLLGLMAGLPFAGWHGAACAGMETFPTTATILTAGPEEGNLDHWGQVVQPAFARNLPAGTLLRRVCVGGADGVTGANQFDARTEPDGQTTLLIPGDAALAWMVGDPRARYDVGRWLPVMAGVMPALVVAHSGAVAAGRPVRIATGNPGGRDLPALLGLELLGARAELRPALSPDATAAAFGEGAVDAVFVRGHNVRDQLAVLRGLDAQPVFALGMIDDTGARIRDPGLAGTPTLDELPVANHGPLRAVFMAAAMATQIDFALVLRQLTPASMVAQWRRAGTEATATADMRSMALSLGVRTVTGPAAAALANATAADQTSLLELRRWLAGRFAWRPA
jgi:hypothetical protein